MTVRTIRVRVSGRVQGVSYRYWTRAEAHKRSLAGWVRNCDDGSVEAVFCGPEAVLDDMCNACRQGPAFATVTNIQIAPETEVPDPGFDIRF